MTPRIALACVVVISSLLCIRSSSGLRGAKLPLLAMLVGLGGLVLVERYVAVVLVRLSSVLDTL